MVLLPGPVEFWMGSPKDEAERFDTELLHRRRIGRGFALASKKVTVAQFQQFLKAYPEIKHSYIIRGYSPEDECPIISVTWYEAAQYCRWLSEQEGIPEDQMVYPSIAEIEKSKDGKTPLKLPAGYLAQTGYRLPTEAEWEYACRATSLTNRYYGSSEEMLRHHAWYVSNAQRRTWPVGQKKPNGFGLFDMLGNTWDWCRQRYTAYEPAKEGKPTDDKEDQSNLTSRFSRMRRGGSFLARAADHRSAFRLDLGPAYRSYDVGLRVARTCRVHRAK
jgi:formylglycine-generating enzyme required for sulfatase activity